MVEDIPGGYIKGGDDHDHKNQVADNFAGSFNHFINPAKSFIEDLTHCGCLLFGVQSLDEVLKPLL
jgi:hypothetical protein